MIGIFSGQDQAVAQWTWQRFKLAPMPFIRAWGLLEDGQPIGSFMFQNYNGIDAEVAYYGPTTTTGVFRFVMSQAVNELKLERMTMKLPRDHKRIIRWLLKMGAIHEGNSRRYYGREDSSRNTAVRLVFFRERMEQILNRGKVH